MNTPRHFTRSIQLLLPVISLTLLTGRGHAAEATQQPTAAEQTELVNALDAKLDGITIPRLQCTKSTLSEVLETIRAAARDHDEMTADPKERGVNIFLKYSGAGTQARLDRLRITLDIKGGSVRKALEAVYCQTGLVWHAEPYAVSFVVEH